MQKPYITSVLCGQSLEGAKHVSLGLSKQVGSGTDSESAQMVREEPKIWAGEVQAEGKKKKKQEKN